MLAGLTLSQPGQVGESPYLARIAHHVETSVGLGVGVPGGTVSVLLTLLDRLLASVAGVLLTRVSVVYLPFGHVHVGGIYHYSTTSLFSSDMLETVPSLERRSEPLEVERQRFERPEGLDRGVYGHQTHPAKLL